MSPDAKPSHLRLVVDNTKETKPRLNIHPSDEQLARAHTLLGSDVMRDLLSIEDETVYQARLEELSVTASEDNDIEALSEFGVIEGFGWLEWDMVRGAIEQGVDSSGYDEARWMIATRLAQLEHDTRLAH